MNLTFRRAWPQAGDIWSFGFEPPAGLRWEPGQSLRLEIPGVYGPLEHRFTIASTPADGEIVVTTRLSGSAYKRKLRQLRPGDTAQAYAIEGTFVWGGETPWRRLFVAAGIGVTPFYAMLKQRLHDGCPMPAALLYGSPDAVVPYRNFFDGAQAARSEFTVEYVTGQRLDARLVAQKASLAQSLVYVSGPSAMVDEVGAGLLDDFGLSPAQLKRDWYTGRLGRDG